MRPRMRREDRRVVAVLGFLHGVVHANILSIPVFLLAWKMEFGADDVTLGPRAVAEQGRGMGWHGMGGSLGIAAGPAYVGTALAVGWSWRPVAGLLVIPGLVALALLVVARLPAETSTPGPGSSRPQVVLLRRS